MFCKIPVTIFFLLIFIAHLSRNGDNNKGMDLFSEGGGSWV